MVQTPDVGVPHGARVVLHGYPHLTSLDLTIGGDQQRGLAMTMDLPALEKLRLEVEDISSWKFVCPKLVAVECWRSWMHPAVVAQLRSYSCRVSPFGARVSRMNGH